MLRIILSILLSSLLFSGYSQEFAYYKTLNKNQSKQAFVYDIDMDAWATTWFATANGVIRKSLNKDSLLAFPISSEYSNFSSAILCAKNEVWVGYYDGGLAKISGYTLENPIANFGSQVVRIIKNAEVLYVATNNALYSYNLETAEKKSIYQNGGQVYDILLNNGNLFLATSEGIQRLKGDQPELLSDKKAFRLKSIDSQILAITKDEVLALSPSSVSSLFQFTNKDFEILIKDFCYLPKLNQYLIASNHGLQNLKKTNKGWELSTAPGKINQLECAVYSLFKAKNTVWIGTYGEGIWFSRPEASPIWLEKNESIKSNDFIWVKQRTDSMLLGSGSVFSPKAQAFKTSNNYNLFKNRLLQFNQGQIIDASIKGTKEYRIANYAKGRPSSFGLVNDSVLYISTAFEGVTFYQYPSLKEIIAFNTGNGLLHNDITQVLPGKKGELWLLSRKAGITLLRDFKIAGYFTIAEGLSSMENTAISYFQDEVWISAEGGGVSVIDQNYQCHQVKLEDGENPEYYYGLGNEKDRIIIYSRQGVYQLKNLKKKFFALPEFSKSVVPSEGPVYFSEDGALIPCYNGVLLIPNLLFEEEGSLSYRIDKISSNLSGKIANGAKIENGKHELKISFDIGSENPLTEGDLSFKLEGYHNDWVGIDKQSITLPSVRSGDYQLKVKNAGKEEVLLSFTVLEPFWKDPIFLAFGFILIILLYLALLRWRTYRLKQRNIELEALVSLRTKDLAKKNEELQQFTYAISHDLKNPAANINELVTALKEDFPDLDEELAFYMGQLDKASGKLYQNLLDLLDVLKHANAGELPVEEVDITEIIEDIKVKISSSIQKNQAEIKLNLAHFQHLTYNKLNLQSILYNLVSNGIKYRREEETPVVEISTFETDKHWGIEIKDNGLGMDLEKNKDTLFGLFQRFHDHVEGSGVGLYLVNSIIEKNGGFIDLQSAPGKGSTFKLHLVPKARVA